MNISIVIPVYNASLTLKECLNSVFNSNYKNFEVIIVSDNSSDNSVEIAKQFKCKIIELPKNMGPAFARNKGAEIAESDVLLFVDSDVIIKKDALNYLNNKFSDNEVDAIQGIYSHEPIYKNMATQYQQSYTSYYITNNANYFPPIRNYHAAETQAQHIVLPDLVLGGNFLIFSSEENICS